MGLRIKLRATPRIKLDKSVIKKGMKIKKKKTPLRDLFSRTRNV